MNIDSTLFSCGFPPFLSTTYMSLVRFHDGRSCSSSSNRITSSFLHLLPLLLLLSLSIRPAAAQTGSPDTTDPYSFDPQFNPSIGVIIAVVMAAFFFTGIFCIYIRHCADSGTSPNLISAATARSRRVPKGLEPAIIDTFPTFAYAAVKNLKIGKGALECAVCLNEFEDDETLRLIPKCDHVFHPDCIDPWLAAHTTCPVCRANLLPEPNESTHSPHQLDETNNSADNDAVNDVVIQVSPGREEGDQENREICESMGRPLRAPSPEVVDLSQRLNRNRARRNFSGRPRWFERFSRSNSTGHLAVTAESMDRFTLRLPEEVRKQIMSGKLTRSTSCLLLPTGGSTRRGSRRPGEGSSRGGRFGSGRYDRAGRSDRWGFSLAPPFFSRWPSMQTPRVAASGGGGSDSVRSPRSTNNSVHSAKGDVAVSSTVESVHPPV
ncbi:hypothetical protein Dimus_021729 [Dionaea muscipula]